MLGYGVIVLVIVQSKVHVQIQMLRFTKVEGSILGGIQFYFVLFDFFNINSCSLYAELTLTIWKHTDIIDAQ